MTGLKTYHLDINKPNLGIGEESFVSTNLAIIKSNSIYDGQYLYELMNYKKDGNYYDFEDEHVVIYDAAQPTPLSSCYIKIK